MIHVHIEANSLHDLRKQLHELLDEPEVTVTPVILPHGDPIPAAPKTAYEVLAKGEWDAEDIPATEAPVVQPEPDAPVAASEPVELPKMEDCRAALNALRAKHGPAAVRTILTNHGVNSFVDLDACEYDKVMREAENYGK
jgi:hypothetical protein